MKAKPSLPTFATFGTLLHYLRRGARLSQRELAVAVGYSESMISRLEHDDRPPDVATILALFVPALHLEDQPEASARLVELAQVSRAEGGEKTVHRSQPAEERRPFAVQHRLPVRLTSFVGREEDIRAVAQLLAKARLVTLTGPGGCGKTSLAVETARRLAEAGESPARQTDNGAAWPLDDIYLVELLPLNDPALLAQTVLTALGLEGNPEQPAQQTLIYYLINRRALLVLDNCEHLVDSVAALVEALLRSLPGLYILATSRERLNIGAETVCVVAPLAFPEATTHREPTQPADYPAVQLFVERTQAIMPGFYLHAENTGAVLRICALLEGSPLALELAAAAAATFSVNEIAQQLDAHLLLAGPGYRTADPRHRQLRDTVEWSYRLLSPAEQRMLVHLAVFAGGWTLDALRSVLGGEAPGSEDGCVALLHQLVRKSLVRAEQQTLPDGPRTRFHLLRAIREFAAERLAGDEKQDAVSRRHFEYYAEFAIQWGDQVLGPQHRAAMAALDTEHPNIRAALTFGAGRQQVVELYARLVTALPHFWRQRGLFTEGLTWLNKAMVDAHLLSLAGRAQVYVAALNLGVTVHSRWFEGIEYNEEVSRLLAQAETLIDICLEGGEEQSAALLMLAVAGLREYSGNETKAEEYARNAWRILLRCGDLRGAGFAGNLLTRILIVKGDLESAHFMHRNVVDLLEQNKVMWELCDTYHIQSMIAHLKHDPAAKLRAARRMAAIAEQEEFGVFLHNAYVLLEGIDAAAALQMAEEFLERQRQQDFPSLLGLALHQLGRMQLNCNHYEQAARLLDAALQFWTQTAGLFEQSPGPSWSLIDRGQAARFMGDAELALACFSESIRLFATSHYPAGSKYPLLFRGQVRLEAGDLDGALDDLQDCLRRTVYAPRGWEKFIAYCLPAIGEVAHRQGDMATAARLFAASAALLVQWNTEEMHSQPHELVYTQRILASALMGRQDPAFEAAWQEGERLALQQAIDLALAA